MKTHETKNEEKESMKIDNELTGVYYGLCNGARIYRVKRGHFQVQNPTRPNQSQFDGTKREIEKALHFKIVQINKTIAAQ